MINLIVLLSFFLDGLLSIYQGPSFFDIISFKPMFTIVSLVLIYPFCLKNHPRYYKICIIVGALYDLLYTDTLVLNMVVFPLLGFIIYKLYIYFAENFLNTIIINIIVLGTYHVLIFLILCLIGYLSFDLSVLSYNFIGILLTNTIFLIILYFIIKMRGIKRTKRSRDCL